MSARALRWFLLASVLFTVACATFWAKIGGGDTIKVPHSVHSKAKIDCVVCHEPIYDAHDMKGDFFPKESKCLECHEDNKKKGECGFCHSDPIRPTSYRRTPSTLKLSHAKHIEQTKEDCTRCHKTLSEKGQPGTPPTMESCFGCHTHKQEYEQGSCGTCHKDLRRYPQKP
ncbi:MAG TPA: cytochrome c3 family protein, partial [Pseudomonadota bacterium]|nr:cytochrome c3 family protein [Pseudomonadota bacterium]